jgi:hypothetical protein
MQALEVGCQRWQERSTIRRGLNLARPLVGDLIGFGIAESTRGSFRSQQDGSEPESKEGAALHVGIEISSRLASHCVLLALKRALELRQARGRLAVRPLLEPSRTHL